MVWRRGRETVKNEGWVGERERDRGALRLGFRVENKYSVTKSTSNSIYLALCLKTLARCLTYGAISMSTASAGELV